MKKKKTGLWVGLILLFAVIGLLPQHEQQNSNTAAQQNAVSCVAESQTDATASSAEGTSQADVTASSAEDASQADVTASSAEGASQADATVLSSEETSQTDATASSTDEASQADVNAQASETQASLQTLDAASIPVYTGEASVVLNDNVPYFTDTEYTTEAFESYSDLDSLGRCGVAYANVCEEIMPTEERGAIGMIKPSGWHTIKYDCVDGKYLYNRCHLIGYQLSGENANEKNLITGTRYLNVTGMLPYEDQVADYVHDTKNHVLYRVTPVFTGDNLVADGVEIEAASVEDKGASLQFHVFCYNVQPGVEINYATGDSHLAEDAAVQKSGNSKAASGNSEIASGNSETASDKTTAAVSGTGSQDKTGSIVAAGTADTDTTSNEAKKEITYVLNKNTHKFHYPSCSSADDIKPKNRKEYTGTREEVIKMGYDPCKRCNP